MSIIHVSPPLPALKVAILLTVGVVLGAFLPPGIPAGVVAATLGIAVVLAALAGRWGWGLLAQSCLALACLLSGMGKLLLDRDRMPVLPPRLAGRCVELHGVVADDPARAGNHTRLTIDSDSVLSDGAGIVFHGRVVVTVLGTREDPAGPRVGYGDRVSVSGEVERPPMARNPGEFNTRAYDEANGISHVMLVRGGGCVRWISGGTGNPLLAFCVLPVRRWILDVLGTTTPGEEGEFLKGLIIGERGGLTAATRDAFVNAGVAHVLAVSGSNVAVVAVILMTFLAVCRVPVRVQIPLAMIGLVGYMLVTGSQPPVVRATLMALTMFSGKLLQRPSPAANSIGAAAILMIALDARQVFDVGFQLSFGAVLSILFLYPVGRRWIRRIPAGGWFGTGLRALLDVCAVSLAATLGTLPTTAASFGKVSVIGVLANIVVIPATSLSVLLGAVQIGAAALSMPLAGIYGALNWLVLHWTLVLTRLAGGSGFAYIDTVRFRALDAIPYYLVLVALLFGGRRHFFRSVLLLLLAGNAAIWTRLPADDMETGSLRVSIIDVGQGDAILIEGVEGKSVLVDAGPWTPTFDAGERTVVPFLRRRGIDTLDLVVITHPHSDHCGGLPAVLARIPSRRLVTILPSRLRKELHGRLSSLDSARCDSLVPGTWIAPESSFRLYVMYPLPGLPVGQGGGNESVVLKLTVGTTAMLLAGDAERAEEAAMVRQFGPFLHADLLKAGHHGSNTSSSDLLLDAVDPREVVIPVGKHNKFRHPSASVLARLRARGIPWSRTDEEGAIIYTVRTNRFSKLEWR